MSFFRDVSAIIFAIVMYMQCSKLRFYFVHTPGAWVAKIVHPVVYPWVLPYKGINICYKKCAHFDCGVHRY